MPVKKINPPPFYAMVHQDDICTNNLNDGEFRVYTYYRSQSDTNNYNLSATTVAKKLNRSERSIQEINKSLISKGYLAIMGHTKATYFVGLDRVSIALKEHKKYFLNKKMKNQKKSKKLKIESSLTKENRLKGSLRKLKKT